MRTVAICCVFGWFACGIQAEPGETDVDGDLNRDQQALAQPGSVGHGDFCVGKKCASGEGDCDSNGQCATGLVCGKDLGRQFAFASDVDVCVLPTCTNETQDGDEMGVDCGGACGECFSCPALSELGSNSFCTAECPCVSGQGDCDGNEQCQAGLSCASDRGGSYGLLPSTDVCVPAACNNGQRDFVMQGTQKVYLEDAIDCGGQCGPCDCHAMQTNGAVNYCSPLCLCSWGAGDCDSDAECTLGSQCLANGGFRYGLPAGTDVCVPLYCTNGQQDGGFGETGVDCGGRCGTCSDCTKPRTFNEFCTIECPCGFGGSDCDNDEQCANGLACVADIGDRFGQAPDVDVCVPEHCGNGVTDVSDGETGIDCGGMCGACALPPPPVDASQPVPVDASQPVPVDAAIAPAVVPDALVSLPDAAAP